MPRKVGKYRDVILVFNDQSQIKAMEFERNRTQQLALIGTIAASMAHEIKNSLVSTRVLAEMLPEKYADPEFRDNFAKIAIAEIDRVDKLIPRFRDLDNPRGPQLVAVDSIEILEDTVSILTSKLMQQEVNAVRSYAPSLPKVKAEPSQLKQVFLNLLLNSLEAMGGAGEIWLKSSVTPKPPSPQAEDVKEMVGISISDTGGGIDDEHLQKIFDHFFTTKEEGTGLGLTICERIIGSFHGKIEVQNNANGKGVTVTVYLQQSEE